MIMMGLLSMVLISQSIDNGEIIHLPQPKLKGGMSLEEYQYICEVISDKGNNPNILVFSMVSTRNHGKTEGIAYSAIGGSAVSPRDLCRFVDRDLSLQPFAA